MSSNRHKKKEKDRPKQRQEKAYVVREKLILFITRGEEERERKRGSVILLDVCA